MLLIYVFFTQIILIKKRTQPNSTQLNPTQPNHENFVLGWFEILNTTTSQLFSMHKNIETGLKYIRNSFFNEEQDVGKRVRKIASGKLFPMHYQHGVGNICLSTSSYSMLSRRLKHTFTEVFIFYVIRTSENIILDIVSTLFGLRREQFQILDISGASRNRLNI